MLGTSWLNLSNTSSWMNQAEELLYWAPLPQGCSVLLASLEEEQDTPCSPARDDNVLPLDSLWAALSVMWVQSLVRLWLSAPWLSWHCQESVSFPWRISTGWLLEKQEIKCFITILNNSWFFKLSHKLWQFFVFTNPFAHPYCALPLMTQTTLVFHLENLW